MYLLTPSLLNSWSYAIESGTMEGFLPVLHREPVGKTEAMIKGDEFEEWAIQNIEELKGGSYQVKVYKEHGNYLLYGRVDVLKAGIVYDVKFTNRYEVGKFYGNYQTNIYLEVVPEAKKMVYIIGNNSSIENSNFFREEYTRQEIEPIDKILNDFEQWLNVTGLDAIYQEKWRSRA